MNENRWIAIGIAVLVGALKLPTLSTPIYWDELVWLGCAHELSTVPLWTVLPGLHEGFPYGNRPPGLFAPMALLFKYVGPSIVLPHLWIMCLSALGVYYTYRLGRLWFGTTAGILAGLFLLSNPLYFAQSGFFLADLPITAMGVTAVYLGVRDRRGPYWLVAMVLLFHKEPAAAVVLAFAGYRFLVVPADSPRHRVRRAVIDAAPLAAIAAYYVWQKVATGYFFVHSDLSEGFFPFDYGLGLEFALGQLRRVNHWLLVAQGKWLAASLIVLALLLRPAFRRRRELVLLLLILICSGYAFVTVWFLPRYVLPVAPFLFIFAGGAIVHLVPDRRAVAVVGATVIACALPALRPDPVVGNGETHLGYLRVVDAHRRAVRSIEADHDTQRVVAPFPWFNLFERAEFGYVTHPHRVSAYRGQALEAGDVVLSSPLSARPGLADVARARGLRIVEEYGEGRISFSIFSE